MLSEVRTHKGVSYLYTNYAGAKTNEDLFSILDQGVALQKSNPELTRILTNVTGTFLSREFADRLKEIGKSEGFKAAIVGVTGIKGVIVNAINMISKFETKVFSNEEEALEWLVSK